MNTYFANKERKEGREGTEPRAARKEVSIALYIACAIVQISGLTVVAYQVGEPSFSLFTISLTLIGTTVSYLLRRNGISAKYLKLGAALLALIFVYALRRAAIFGMLIPPDSSSSQEMVLVSALAFTATFGSFLLITDDAVVFTCVWTIAMIGLTGTVNVNRELPICFVIFLAAASFVLVHQNAIALSDGMLPPQSHPALTDTLPGAAGAPRPLWRLLRTHILMALCAWGSALILGALIAIPVQMVGRNMSLGAIIQRLHVPAGPATHAGSSPHLFMDNVSQFTIGIGPVDDDPTERMTVLSAAPHYWRGRVFDTYKYDTHEWVNSWVNSDLHVEPIRPTAQSPDVNGLNIFDLHRFQKDLPARKKTERVVNDFYEVPGTHGPLYHAAEPMQAHVPMTYLDILPNGLIGSGFRNEPHYLVVSEVSDAGPSDLRHSSTDYSPEIQNRYLNADNSNDAIQALMANAVASAPKNPFDRAAAIKRFISQRCIYTRDARAIPPDRDPVEYFLNESREGYCDLYASAMVVLCRYAGIPARLATGFAPGAALSRADDPNPPPSSEKRTKYRLLGDDLHAWAEVYFTGYGWFVFDPTEDTGGVKVAAQTPQPVPKSNHWARFLRTIEGPLAFVILGAVLLLFGIFNELRSRLRGLSSNGWRTGSGMGAPLSHNRIEAIALYRDGIRRVTRHGVPRTNATAPGEYVARVDTQLGHAVASALGALTGVGQQALYAGDRDDITSDDLTRSRAALQELKTALKEQKKKRKGAAS